MATLEQLLGYRNLTGVIQAVKSGIPNPLPAAFMTPGRSFSGNRGEYYKVEGTRQTARLAHYGSPAQRRDLKGVSLVQVTLLHAYESQQWPLTMTINLMKMKEFAQDKMGEEQAAFQTEIFKKLFANLRIVAAIMALFKGILYYDGAGNVLPTSSGAVYTVDFGIPAGNKGQLNALGAGAIIATKWTNTAALIVTNLIQIRTAALKLTGYPIKYAFYGDKVAECVGSNATAREFLVRNAPMNQAFINNPTSIPDGFGGIPTWIAAGSSFFQDKDNAVQALLGDYDVVFCPEYSSEWFEMFQGSYPVPTTVTPVVNGDATSLLSNVQEVFGMFGYGVLSHNPPSIEQFAGDTFFPALKVPKAVFQATVDF